MIEKLKRKKLTTDFNQEINSVFSLGSGGMGVHLFAVRKLFSGKKLKDFEEASIKTRHSNMFASPYIQDWLWNESTQPSIFMFNDCPDSEQHRKLMKTVNTEYGQIKPDNLENFKQVAVHKLGTMLAITNQILFDAYTSGQPIPASYKPEYQEEWKKSFGKDLPTIEELYLEAHKVLTDFASPDDLLIAHLLPLPNLTYFSREPTEPVKSEGLSKKIIEQLKVLQSAHKIHSTYDELPTTLPIQWKALSVGGDTYKLIAANEELGIIAKRYARPEYAALVSQGYELIRSTVMKSEFPLILSLGVYEDILVFPFYKVIRDGKDINDHEAMKDLKELLKGIPLPLDLADFLNWMVVEGDRFMFNDPFKDSVIDLYKKTGLFID